MREIELVTSAGEFVAIVDIAPFPDRGLPDVVGWGDRVFRLHGTSVRHSGMPLYREGFGVVSFTPSPGRSAPTPPPPVDRSARATLHGMDPDGPEHRELEPGTGMQKDYIVLSAEERAKGFVRPVRRSYTHARCGTSTRMGLALCETYARDPQFYSGTFCVACKDHFPVGPGGEFTWDEDGTKVGT